MFFILSWRHFVKSFDGCSLGVLMAAYPPEFQQLSVYGRTQQWGAFAKGKLHLTIRNNFRCKVQIIEIQYSTQSHSERSFKWHLPKSCFSFSARLDILDWIFDSFELASSYSLRTREASKKVDMQMLYHPLMTHEGLAD